ncbi:DUF4386 domain-containing protein ['Paenibacillus yunnanensis' Narsing Rao et al. 2020]|uniref:DUF4386 domain-containing protein n=1 Tax=Paenibacillus tengchongensis TaxID=2608684 RepID=UPI00124BE5EC|nr:DUF4386 domain-containing protein [Paenibacillus tengchongensis]
MKNVSRGVGLLFLLSTGVYLLGSGLLEPVLDRPELLAGLYPERTTVWAGFFLELINAIAVVAIGMLLYPILKKYNEAFALGYFGSRLIESVLLLLSAAAPLLLLALSKDFIAGGNAREPYDVTAASMLLEGYSVFFQIAMIMLGLGSLLLCTVLYRSRLIPRFLSILGYAGYAALLVSGCLTLLGQESGSILYIPGAIFEIAFPVWLIVKGLKQRT